MKSRFVIFTVMTWLSGCASLLSYETQNQPISDNNAVSTLVETARTDATAGKLDAAGASIERALRIEPQNPALWHELAKLRLQQEQYQQK